MLYRRRQNSSRKHIPIDPDSEEEVKKPKPIKTSSNIPLPTEAEDITDQTFEDRSHSSLYIDIFKKRIFLDEIILVGLIFLLFEEGIEDEFLLIILVYILMAGRL